MTKKNYLLFIALVLLFSSCIANYSKDSLETWQSLKRDIIEYTMTFDQEIVDWSYGEILRQQLVQFRESENRRDENNNSVKQIDEIIKIYNRNLSHRKEHGVWSKANKDLQIEILEITFDTAIRSEQNKPGGDI